ncbi:MAG: septum formation initiator family protein [Bacillota bacterium]|nr:septum formation initiator family protein [Bacillota bacterium]
MIKRFKLKHLIVIVLIINVCYIMIRQQIVMHNIKTNMNEVNKLEAKLKEENKNLQEEVKLSQSSGYVEKLAREKLGLIKEGETPVIDSSSAK